MKFMHYEIVYIRDEDFYYIEVGPEQWLDTDADPANQLVTRDGKHL